MNKPNILDNALDQAPKTGEGYARELYAEDLQKQIINAFGAFVDFIDLENDVFVQARDKNLLEWFRENQQNFPIQLILEGLKNTYTVSCEIQREKKEVRGWNTAIGPAIAKEHTHLGQILTRNQEPVEGHVVTYITFNKTKDLPLTIDISAQQIEFPGEGALLSDWMVFFKKLSGEELIQK